MILHHENASSHTARQTKGYLSSKNVEILVHPPYSPKLSPNDFFTFPKIKQSLRGQRFNTPEEAVEAYKAAILTTPSSEWNKCFKNWFERMEKCIKYRGCTYKAVKMYENFEADAGSFDGTLFEWRGAVRAPEAAVIGVWLGWRVGYHFIIGYDVNKSTTISAFYSAGAITREQSTPGVLSADHYVAFYVRIHAGNLTLGRECDRTPILTHEVSVERGAMLKMFFMAYSPRGAKFLYNCPSNVAGRSEG